MPRLLSPRPLAAALAVVIALTAGACSEDEDVTQAQFASDLRERTRDTEGDETITADEADCFSAAVFDRYDQAEINRIYTAATEEELTNERRDELLQVATDCGIEPATASTTTTTTTEAG